jgi:hypothetical protein
LCAAASRQLSEVQRPSNHAVVTRSAAHLAAILFPATLCRLYIVRDDNRAGDGATNGLIELARTAGIEAIALSPRCGDFNEDLRSFGVDALLAAVCLQIVPEDVTRCLRHESMGRDGV